MTSIIEIQNKDTESSNLTNDEVMSQKQYTKWDRPPGYNNAVYLESVEKIHTEIQWRSVPAIYHFAVYRPRRLRDVIPDYYHHFVVFVEDGSTLEVYENASYEKLFTWEGIASVSVKEKTVESFEEEEDVKNGIWLLREEDYPITTSEIRSAQERAIHTVGEKRYLPSGENCESYARYLMTGQGESFQMNESLAYRAFILNCVELIALFLNRCFLLFLILNIGSSVVGSHFGNIISLLLVYMVHSLLIFVSKLCFIFSLRSRYRARRINEGRFDEQNAKYFDSSMMYLIFGFFIPAFIAVFFFSSDGNDMKFLFYLTWLGFVGFLINFFVYGVLRKRESCLIAGMFRVFY